MLRFILGSRLRLYLAVDGDNVCDGRWPNLLLVAEILAIAPAIQNSLIVQACAWLLDEIVCVQSDILHMASTLDLS